MRLDYLPCLFIHIYLCSALPTAEAGIFVACAIHVRMQSRIYVKKCRQASRINLLPFLILSFPSPSQHLKVQSTPRIEIACTVSAPIRVFPLLHISMEVERPLSECWHRQQHSGSPTHVLSGARSPGPAVAPSLSICPSPTHGKPHLPFA